MLFNCGIQLWLQTGIKGTLWAMQRYNSNAEGGRKFKGQQKKNHTLKTQITEWVLAQNGQDLWYYK